MPTTWVLWLSDCGGKETWTESLKQLGVARTVKEFEDLYQQLPKPSELVPGVDYEFFRDGLVPDWDRKDMHGDGGRWVMNDANIQRRSLDEVWRCLCKALLTGAFGKYEEFICGVYVKIRKTACKATDRT
uniref:EIF-4F 25 kDa subunit n=1 Tax=Steinernema glaseri TaxID=37863 RepID=A0A1I8AIU6_9BILA